MVKRGRLIKTHSSRIIMLYAYGACRGMKRSKFLYKDSICTHYEHLIFRFIKLVFRTIILSLNCELNSKSRVE